MQTKYTRHQFLIDSVRSHGDSDECLVWPFAVHRKLPYGRVPIDGGETTAHRLSYRYFRGEIFDAMDVLHSCDNPPCYNPKHLYLGTDRDNQRDCVIRGRRPTRPGELNPAHKLSEQAITDIHAMRSDGASISKISRHVSINQSHAWDILRGAKWKHRAPSEYGKIVHRGEANSHHKLTLEDVINIHRMSKNGVSSRNIAAEFRITREHVWCILTFRSWAHVKPQAVLLAEPAQIQRELLCESNPNGTDGRAT